MIVLVLAVLALAALPIFLTIINLHALRTPALPARTPRIAILIPARDEETTIGPCIRAALASVGAEIEIVVLDDGSTDRTAEIVRDFARSDARVRLETAPPLPAGWTGKQHACHVLSTLTTWPIMLFIDADVLLEPEGAARLAAGLDQAEFVSAVPRQRMERLLERIVVPMINTLILAYLPIPAMRQSQREAFGVGCGQLIMVRREAYCAAGGHAASRAFLHDGLKLARLFRRNGFRTDLVDGTALAVCRMYDNEAALLRGFVKNATEGMATPVALPIWTLLLFGGHCAPFLLLAWALGEGRNSLALPLAVICVALLVARTLQALRLREPLMVVPLYPLGVVVTLAIQWTALVRRLIRIETAWRGRTYRAQG
jgi:hypothetical protein